MLKLIKESGNQQQYSGVLRLKGATQQLPKKDILPVI
jgi:hypothetical protein